MATANIPTIEGVPRTQLGSRNATRLRKQGRLPAVIYGHKQNPAHISLDAKQLTDLLHRHTHVLEVRHDSNSKSEPCLIKDVQWDHLGSHIVHLDLARVDLTEKVKTSIGLELIGEPVGLKQAGAMLEHPHSEIEVECLAANIPDRLHADISNVDLNKPLTIADLELPEGVVCTLAPEAVLASITILAIHEEEAEEVEAGEAEPEVIGGKKEEEPSAEQAKEDASE